MDAKEILELLILSMEKFGSVVTLVMFALVGVFVYFMRNKTKTEKVLTATLELMNKNNSDSVKMTAENIEEIRNMVTDVLKSTHTLNGEIRGIVDILKFLMVDYQVKTKDESEDTDEEGDN